jgi:diguanylate cyclase (GGDEF)-like protein
VNNPSGQNDDDIVDLAKLICETSAAHVSLIDSSQQRTKPCIDADPASRVVHYCEQTMARPNELFVVPDVRHDVQFADCPMEFDGTQVCFYAGVALVNADGDTLGTLYVIDQVPHELTENQQDALWALSRQVVTRVELRNAVDELESNTARLRDYQSQLEEYQQRLELTNARLRTLSVTDDLTGLNNRFAFEEEFRNEFSRAQQCDLPLSLLFLDADYFKLYNDEFGHPAGDDALRTIAEYLTGSMRTSDFIARIGGDEFVIILPETPSERAGVLAERCRKALELATWPERPITVSIGTASLDRRTIDADTLISEADQALYHAKATGRNQVSLANDLEGQDLLMCASYVPRVLSS